MSKKTKDPFGRKVEYRKDDTKNFGDTLRFYVKGNWIFEKWYEKLIIILLVAWAMYSFSKYLF